MQINSVRSGWIRLFSEAMRKSDMCATCVVVAESSRARVFEMINPRTPMKELKDMVHTQSRIHEQKLTSDRPGRTFDRHGQGHHAMEQEVSVKEQEVQAFTGQLAEYLQTECGENEFEDIIIIAAPEFLGLLRKKLDRGTRKRVVREIDKNIVKKDEADIRKHL